MKITHKKKIKEDLKKLISIHESQKFFVALISVNLF